MLKKPKAMVPWLRDSKANGIVSSPLGFRGRKTDGRGIEFHIPHSLRGVSPYGPYGFRLVDRAYSSERPEAEFNKLDGFAKSQNSDFCSM